MTEGEFQKQLKKYHETWEMPVKLAVKLLSECNTDCVYEEEIEEAFGMAIKALEQEPCEDAISRKSLIDAFRATEDAGHATWTLKGIENEINEMPSVTPIRPKGHWRAVYQGDEIIDYRCSECEFGNTFGKGTYGMNYCPNCGAKMVEPQESEG